MNPYEPPMCSCGCGKHITDYRLSEYLEHRGWPRDDAKAVHGAVKDAVKSLLPAKHKAGSK